MRFPTRDNYKRYRYPKSVVGYAARLYHRYKLSFRDVRDILLDLLKIGRYKTSAKEYRQNLKKALGIFNEIVESEYQYV